MRRSDTLGHGASPASPARPPIDQHQHPRSNPSCRYLQHALSGVVRGAPVSGRNGVALLPETPSSAIASSLSCIWSRVKGPPHLSSALVPAITTRSKSEIERACCDLVYLSELPGRFSGARRRLRVAVNLRAVLCPWPGLRGVFAEDDRSANVRQSLAAALDDRAGERHRSRPPTRAATLTEIDGGRDDALSAKPGARDLQLHSLGYTLKTPNHEVLARPR